MIHCLAPVIFVVGRARAHRARVRAGARLGQRERGELLAGGEPRHVLGDLLRRAVVEDRQRAGARVHGDGHADAGVGARELLEHEHVGEEVRARAAVLLRHAHAHQAELAELGEQVAREVVVAIPLRRRAARSSRRRSGARARGSRAGRRSARAGSCADRPRATREPARRRAAAAAIRSRRPRRSNRMISHPSSRATRASSLSGLTATGCPTSRSIGRSDSESRVRVGRGQVDALARGQLADRLRLALAVVERAALAAGVDAVDDLGDAADRAVEREHDRHQLGHLLRGRGADEDRAALVLMRVGELEHARIQAREHAGEHACRRAAGGRAPSRPRASSPTRSRTASVALSVEPLRRNLTFS